MSEEENLLQQEGTEGTSMGTGDEQKMKRVRLLVQRTLRSIAMAGIIMGIIVIVFFMGSVLGSGFDLLLNNYGYALWKVGSIPSVALVITSCVLFLAPIKQVPSFTRVVNIMGLPMIGISFVIAVAFDIRGIINWNSCNQLGASTNPTSYSFSSDATALCQPYLFWVFQILFWANILESLLLFGCGIVLIMLLTNTEALVRAIAKISDMRLLRKRPDDAKSRLELKAHLNDHGISSQFLSDPVDKTIETHFPSYARELYPKHY